MARNLDLTSLRSLVAIVDTGGVTRAAGFLNLTQSAVSMQIRRLEEALAVELLDRSTRKVGLTAAGEQLLGYARRMLALNDEAQDLFLKSETDGQIVLGVPHDIVYPVIPHVMQQFARTYPRIKVQLLSSFTRTLKEQFASGVCDLILTTEDAVGPGGEALTELQLVWIGAPGGHCWRQRPLRLAFEKRCIFRQGVQNRLDAAGIAWVLAVDSENTRTVEAMVSADLAVHTVLEGSEPRHAERINHGGALPPLARIKVNMYVREASRGPALPALVELLRREYVGAQAKPAKSDRESRQLAV